MSNTTIPAETLQSVTDRMHEIEQRMMQLNKKCGYQVDTLTEQEQVSLTGLTDEWDELKQTRDRLKIGARK